MGREEVEFICPECSSCKIEEIQAGITVATEISDVARMDDGHIDHLKGEQTNEDGYVDRYQCGECGYTILDCSEFTEDWENAVALFEALKALQNKRA